MKLLVKNLACIRKKKVSFGVFEHNISFSANRQAVWHIDLYSYKSVKTFCKEQYTLLGRLRALWRQERRKNERLSLFFWDGRRFVLQVLADFSKNCSAFTLMVTKMKMKALRYFETPGRRKVARPKLFLNPVKRKNIFPSLMRPYRPWCHPLSYSMGKRDLITSDKAAGA